jgi:hypothetical protein
MIIHESDAWNMKVCKSVTAACTSDSHRIRRHGPTSGPSSDHHHSQIPAQRLSNNERPGSGHDTRGLARTGMPHVSALAPPRARPRRLRERLHAARAAAARVVPHEPRDETRWPMAAPHAAAWRRAAVRRSRWRPHARVARVRGDEAHEAIVEVARYVLHDGSVNVNARLQGRVDRLCESQRDAYAASKLYTLVSTAHPAQCPHEYAAAHQTALRCARTHSADEVEPATQPEDPEGCRVRALVYRARAHVRMNTVLAVRAQRRVKRWHCVIWAEKPQQLSVNRTV